MTAYSSKYGVNVAIPELRAADKPVCTHDLRDAYNNLNYCADQGIVIFSHASMYSDNNLNGEPEGAWYLVDYFPYIPMRLAGDGYLMSSRFEVNSRSQSGTGTTRLQFNWWPSDMFVSERGYDSPYGNYTITPNNSATTHTQQMFQIEGCDPRLAKDFAVERLTKTNGSSQWKSVIECLGTLAVYARSVGDDFGVVAIAGMHVSLYHGEP